MDIIEIKENCHNKESIEFILSKEININNILLEYSHMDINYTFYVPVTSEGNKVILLNQRILDIPIKEVALNMFFNDINGEKVPISMDSYKGYKKVSLSNGENNNIIFKDKRVYEEFEVNTVNIIVQAAKEGNKFDNSTEVSEIISCLEGDKFDFINEKICIELKSSMELSNINVLLSNETNSKLICPETNGNKIYFTIPFDLNTGKYKIKLIGKTKTFDLCFFDVNVISVEPTICIRDSKYKLSISGNDLYLEKSQLQSYVLLNRAMVENNEIIIEADYSYDVMPGDVKVIIKGRKTKTEQEFEAKLVNSSNGLIIKSTIGNLDSEFLVREKYLDIFVKIRYENYLIMMKLSSKGNYYEQIKTIKLGKKNISVYTKKDVSIGLRIANKRKIITKKKNNYLYYIFEFYKRIIKTNDNLVIFESYLGRQISCHPRAMYDYLKEVRPDLKLIWSIAKGHEEEVKEQNIPYVKRFTLKWFKYMASAKYWVSNSRLPLWMKKPQNTIYLQTWHGTPLKRLASDMNEVHMPNTNTYKYKKNFYKESRQWDYLVSPNRFSTNIFSRAFDTPMNKIIESGSPRNDFLITNKDNIELVKRIKDRYGIPNDKKVILYAPTWRDDKFHKKGKYKFEAELDLELLQKAFSEEYVVILRMHYLVADSIDLTGYEGFAFNISTGDIRDLYLISDILVTDYSSVFFDYAVLKRPTLFFMYDYEDYRDRLRGFYLDVERHLPGAIVTTNEKLVEEIKKLEFSTNNKKLEDFSLNFCELEDGFASKKVCEVVFESDK